MASADEQQKLQTALSHHQNGNINEAAKLYRELIAANSRNSYALHFLGVIEAGVGHFDEAKSLIANSLSLQPGNVQFIENYASILFQIGDYKTALQICEQGRQIDQSNVTLSYVSAVALLKLNRLQDALVQFDRVLSQQPNHLAALNERGSALAELKQYDAAIASVEKALAVNPHYAEAHLNKGNLYLDLTRTAEAIVCYEKALALKPDLAEAWLGMGNVFRAIKQNDQALAAYDKALAANPSLAQAWFSRSNLCKAIGRFDEAIDSFDRLLKLTTPKDHDKYDNVIALGRSIFSLDCIQAIYGDEAEIEQCRMRITGTMEAINRELNAIGNGAAVACPQSVLEAVFQTHGFHIAYQQDDDRQLMRSYSQALRKILQVDDRAPMPRTKRSDKIRLGIASELLKDHPGARYAYEWLSNLPKDDYEFFIYAFHGGVDGLTRKFETLGTFKRLPFTLASFKYSIDVMRADGLDFLMLPDVGMSASSRVLSQYRIAPVQFTSWGHPVTTGSPNIDYFLSSDLVELPDSDKHYTERLIRLPNTSRFIESDDSAAGESATFDLPSGRVLYGCLQSMYKLLPQYDFVYPKIAKRVPDACFVFIEGDPSYATAILKKRLARAFEQEGLSADRYVRFLPRMTAKQYAGLFSAIDVNIDSIGWSGGYTTIESIAADCPVVTLPTEYMRGRHSYAMLKVMGVDELIAMSAPDFIDKLAELGAEPSRRLAVKKKIAQRKHKLYRDRAVIEALDAFLKNEFSKISSSSLDTA